MDKPTYRPVLPLVDHAQAAAFMGRFTAPETTCGPEEVLTPSDRALLDRLLGLFAKPGESVGTATILPSGRTCASVAQQDRAGVS